MKNNKKENKNKKNSSSNKLLLLFVIITIILLIISFITLKIINKKINKVEKENTSITNFEWIKPNGVEANLYVYENESTNKVYVSNNKDDVALIDSDYKLISVYKCSNKNCFAYNSYYDLKYVIINDGNNRLYNYKKNLYKNINIPNDNYSTINLMYYKKKIYGYALQNNNYMSAIYYTSTKKLTDFIYKKITSINSSAELELGYVIVTYDDDNKEITALIDIKNKKTLLETKEKEILYSVNNNDFVYFIKKIEENNEYKYEIYNNGVKRLFIDKDISLFGISDGGNVAVGEENNYSLYNFEGNIIKKSKNYKEILLILNDYILVEDNDNFVKIIDYDGNVLTKLFKTVGEYSIYKDISGFSIHDGHECIKLLIKEDDTTKEYYYIPTTKEKGMNIINDKTILDDE